VNCLLCGKARDQRGSLLCTGCKRKYPYNITLPTLPALDQVRMRDSLRMAVIARRYKVRRAREARQ